MLILSTGSYGGFLAIQTRIRAPDTFFGSIASFPAYQSSSVGGYSTNPLVFSAFDAALNAWFDESAKCFNQDQEHSTGFQQVLKWYGQPAT